MKPFKTEEEMREKTCPMSMSGPKLKNCIGYGCMMFQKQYKVEGISRGRGESADVDFVSKFQGYYCGLSNKRNKR